MKKLLLVSAMLISTSVSANAQHSHHSHHHGHNHASVSNAPIGIMGDHMHEKGDWMFSYRFMRMEMEGNLRGTSNISAETIATTIPNPFAGPATLRVVPTEMRTNMHMLGAMYAPTDYLTAMLMVNYLDRSMDHITFQGGAGTTVLGTFNTKSKGWGDTKASTLIKLYEDNTHHVHASAGLNLPTGSIKEQDQVLTPMGTTDIIRLPYAMQLGSGTYDLLPGVTYTGQSGHIGWGSQYMATVRMGRNSQGYSLGNKHQLAVWGSYSFTPTISATLRVTGEHEGDIDGIDSQITAPVQTANPDNYGGKRVSTSLGVNTTIPNGVLAGHNFSFEATLPVYQNVNGVQMERDRAFMFGWTKSF